MSAESFEMPDKEEEGTLSTENGSDEVKQLSKNQLKKLKKREKWMQMKDQKRFVMLIILVARF